VLPRSESNLERPSKCFKATDTAATHNQEDLLTRTSSAREWFGVGAACLIGVVAATQCWPSSRLPASADRGGSGASVQPIQQRARGAYRPEARRQRSATTPFLVAASDQGGDDALSPELEQRLRAARSIEVVPAPQLAGQARPLPPSGPLSPELESQRRAAFDAWQAEAQQLLDDCVGRPAPLRQPVMLTVFLAPPLAGTGHMPQQLSVTAVSVPVDDLRRLWRDSDPDAVQSCVDRLRELAIVVPRVSDDSPQVLPPTIESVWVTL
jgi:hypothetical protein